jgi:hypothetical protein
MASDDDKIFVDVEARSSQDAAEKVLPGSCAISLRVSAIASATRSAARSARS